jgi:hypothetical protein
MDARTPQGPTILDRVSGKLRQISRDTQRAINRRVSAPFANSLSLPINLRYKRYLARCQAAYAADGQVRPQGESELARSGYEIHKGCLPAAQCNEMSAMLTAANERNAPGIFRAPTWNDRHISFSRPLDIFGDRFFDVISPSVDEGARRYFGSYYKVQVVHAVRVYPIPEAQGSFLWHIDDMPQEAVSLFVYLTDTDQYGGTTAFLDREETAALRRKGYTGHVTRQRIDDIAAFGSSIGVPLKPFRPELVRGDGILWQNNVLHRGILPTRGFRDLLSIMLLPSPRPWRKELEREGFEVVQSRADNESIRRWSNWIVQLNNAA